MGFDQQKIPLCKQSLGVVHIFQGDKLITCQPYHAKFLTTATCLARLKKASQAGSWGHGSTDDGMRYEGCLACEIGKELTIKGEKPMETQKPYQTPKKECTKCGQVKPLAEFGWEGKAKDKRKAVCKECFNAKQREYHAAKVTPPKPEDNGHMYILRHSDGTTPHVMEKWQFDARMAAGELADGDIVQQIAVLSERTVRARTIYELEAPDGRD
ncbi:MAG: hypothetical protein U1D31_00590 [Patescibacteria group bacterium]|nr:hypothetical protein [Patescibacteria group bacterium]